MSDQLTPMKVVRDLGMVVIPGLTALGGALLAHILEARRRRRESDEEARKETWRGVILNSQQPEIADWAARWISGPLKGTIQTDIGEIILIDIVENNFAFMEVALERIGLPRRSKIK